MPPTSKNKAFEAVQILILRNALQQTLDNLQSIEYLRIRNLIHLLITEIDKPYETEQTENAN